MTYVTNQEEVYYMPRRDGTGPLGSGPMTGRGLGPCIDANAAVSGVGFGMGLRLACRRGFGRGFGKGFAINQVSSETEKEVLNEQKTILQEQLKAIDEQLEDL